MRYFTSEFLLVSVLMLMIASCNKDETDNPTNNTSNNTYEICGDTIFVDQRDGQVYNIVQIGSQCWFAENLNYKIDSSWCYSDITSNCTSWGRLYKWNKALSACPNGWHLPTYGEWDELIDYLGGAKEAEDKLKSTSGNWTGVPTNTSGFSALRTGYRYKDGSYSPGGSADWWSTTEFDSDAAWSQILDETNLRKGAQNKNAALSCRCIKD